MNNIFFYLVIVLNIFIGISYCHLIIRKRIYPSLAMWIFFTIAVCGSLTTYLYYGNYSPLDNILNTSDIIFCLAISLTIIIFGDSSSKFNRFDIFCLISVILILSLWFFTKAHFMANLSLQIIQIIAYFPVYNRMIKSGENKESFFMWSLVLLVSVISLFTSKGILATIYSTRAIVCVSCLLLLMLFVEFNKKAGKKKPAR